MDSRPRGAGAQPAPSAPSWRRVGVGRLW